MSECDIFIFVGEVSADLHGEKLLQSLLKKDPNLKVCGVAGPKMRALGMKCLMPMEDFQVMGFVDVFLALPKLIRQFYIISRLILSLNPKVVLFIDYPGFNLRMAAHLRKKHFKGKLCHYICPSVWAWGKKRIPKMAATLDLLLTILPFEKKYFENTSLNVQYVGHPLTKRLKTYNYQTLVLPKDKKLISIFPGSRTKEIQRNFPIYLHVAKKLLSSYPDLIFGISVSHPRFESQIQKIIHDEGLKIDQEIILVPSERTYDLMRSSYLAMAKSGTVTLELALHGVPTVVTYGVSKLDILIARDILRIRLPYYCLVNIIYNGTVFPELIGPNFSENSLYNEMDRFLSDSNTRDQCHQKCLKVKEILQDKDASEEASKKLLGLLEDKD